MSGRADRELVDRMIDEIDELRRRVTELMKERIDEDVKRAAKALREAQVALWFLHVDAMGTVYEIAAAIIKSKLNDLLETFEVCFLDNSKGEEGVSKDITEKLKGIKL